MNCLDSLHGEMKRQYEQIWDKIFEQLGPEIIRCVPTLRNISVLSPSRTWEVMNVKSAWRKNSVGLSSSLFKVTFKWQVRILRESFLHFSSISWNRGTQGSVYTKRFKCSTSLYLGLHQTTKSKDCLVSLPKSPGNLVPWKLWLFLKRKLTICSLLSPDRLISNFCNFQ